MVQRLIDHLKTSTCNFLAVDTITKELDKAGFTRICQCGKWDLKAGGKYYVVKNGSAVFAFVKGTKPAAEGGFRIISSHSDSPCFKIKPNAEIYNEGGVVTLNVEKYGGVILYTWFDRPLSISGRIMLRGKDALHPETRLIDLKRPVCEIPHLAIHFNRAVNEGNPLSVQKDMKPVLGIYSPEEIEECKRRGGAVKMLVAKEAGVEPEDIIQYELNLYPVADAKLVGAHEELIEAARLDDLEMSYASLEALLATCDTPHEATRVMAVFDNEETGSGTKQGAHSPVLRDIFERICLEEGEPAGFYRALAQSFMISADNAHAWHPNYNEKYDPTNHAKLGGGPVIKINANCKYMTDADGAAVFSELCREADVPCQYFVNHSDVLGGSTLGNILTGQMDLRGVDMGCGVWAMHSALETGSAADYVYTAKVFTKFFE